MMKSIFKDYCTSVKNWPINKKPKTGDLKKFFVFVSAIKIRNQLKINSKFLFKFVLTLEDLLKKLNNFTAKYCK